MSPQTKIRKKRIEYTFDDVTPTEVELMSKASGCPEGHWFMWGKYWNKMYHLNLIEEEGRLTPTGHAFLKAWWAREEAKKSQLN